MLLGNALNVFFAIGILILCSLLTYMAVIKKERSVERYLLFILFTWTYLFLIKMTKFPSEKIHLLEYGVLGVFVYNALKTPLGRYNKWLYISAAAICAAIGLLDEGIQLVLPGRYFGWTDVLINIVSSVTALFIIRFNILAEKPKSFTMFH